jgi:hypothetical protein
MKVRESQSVKWSVADNAIEAAARCCATLRINGTGSRAQPWKVRTFVRDGRRFRECASWRIPTFSSKVRSWFRRCATFRAHLRTAPRLGGGEKIAGRGQNFARPNGKSGIWFGIFSGTEIASNCFRCKRGGEVRRDGPGFVYWMQI